MVNEKLTIFSVQSYDNCYNRSRWNYKNFDVLTDTAKNSWLRAPGKCVLFSFLWFLTLYLFMTNMPN